MKFLTSNKKFAVINKGTNVVENVVLWDGVSKWDPGSDFFLIEVTGINPMGTGMLYDNGNFVFILEE